MTRFYRAALLRGALPSLILGIASPALADHTGPTGVGSSGGAIDVQGPETLEAGHFAIGQQSTLNQPQDRSDAELATLAGQHIHAHNADYTLNAAFGTAYGVTDRLTISAELPYIRRDGLREELANMAASAGMTLAYGEIDPDVFGEELSNAPYREVDRIAVVAAIFERAT